MAGIFLIIISFSVLTGYWLSIGRYFEALLLYFWLLIFVFSERENKEELALLFSLFFLFSMYDKGLGSFEIGFTLLPAYSFAMLGGILLFNNRIKKNDWLFIKTPLDIWFFVFFTVVIISAFQTRFVVQSFMMSRESSALLKVQNLRTIGHIMALSFGIYFYYFLVNTISKEKLLKGIFYTLFISATLVSVLSLFAFLGWYFEFNYKYAIFEKLARAGVVVTYPNLRVSGFMPEPQFFSMYLAALLPIEICLLFKNRWIKYYHLLPLIFIQMAAFFFTFSRAGYISLLVSLLIIFIFSFKKLVLNKKRFVAISVIIILLFIMISYRVSTARDIPYDKFTSGIFEVLKNRFILSSIITKSQIEQVLQGHKEISGNWGVMLRLNNLVTGIKMWMAHPILGVGWGNFYFMSSTFDPEITLATWTDNQWVPITPDNLPILILTETGAVGFSIFLTIILVLGRTYTTALWKSRKTDWYFILLGFMASFAGIMLSLQFIAHTYLAFVWAIVAIGISCRRFALEDIKNINSAENMPSLLS